MDFFPSFPFTCSKARVVSVSAQSLSELAVTISFKGSRCISDLSSGTGQVGSSHVRRKPGGRKGRERDRERLSADPCIWVTAAQLLVQLSGFGLFMGGFSSSAAVYIYIVAGFKLSATPGLTTLSTNRAEATACPNGRVRVSWSSSPSFLNVTPWTLARPFQGSVWHLRDQDFGSTILK
ncbi:hypothetical protein BS17DRAFT_357309 [Gyrodon lividus]|nr:hypothetical protein BS17DRAFT_357309 [Gyrodon lividus]